MEWGLLVEWRLFLEWCLLLEWRILVERRLFLGRLRLGPAYPLVIQVQRSKLEDPEFPGRECGSDGSLAIAAAFLFDGA